MGTQGITVGTFVSHAGYKPCACWEVTGQPPRHAKPRRSRPVQLQGTDNDALVRLAGAPRPGNGAAGAAGALLELCWTLCS